jgi:hypothetical protein
VIREVLVAMLRAGLAALVPAPKPEPKQALTAEQIAAFTFCTLMASHRGSVDDGRDHGGPAMQIAQRIADEIALRDALDRAIRKFSPRQQRGQA